MIASPPTTDRIQGYCAMCWSHCGSIAVKEDGRFVALEPDPSHPTGQALCAKGRAAPELVYNANRLLYPLKRTHPKGDPDPGWQRISWDEALDLTATAIRRLASESGPESVAFSVTSPAATAMSDSFAWVRRLMRTFGTPNMCFGVELCGFHRQFASRVTFGTGLPTQDFEQTGCMLLWGANPSTGYLSQATGAVAARARGARLVVVDPRRAGLAAKADLWLRVRPGTDGALALGIANCMIERAWYDHGFIRDWSNGPLLVRSDNGRLLTERDLSAEGSPQRYVAWDAVTQRPLVYDPVRVRYERDGADPALFGAYRIVTPAGEVVCQPAFDLYRALCQRYTSETVEAITWVPAAMIEQTARLLWESRPVTYAVWTGLEQHTNAAQSSRAVAMVYALTGSYDAPGGNVLLPQVPTADIAGEIPLAPEQRARALGIDERPLGPAGDEMVTSDDLYRAILEQRPYAVKGLVGFGANLLLGHADARRGREALAALDFFVHADLFMTPTAELADVVLPVASAFEREGLMVGFLVSAEAQSHVQLRPQVVEPPGEARSDTRIVFDLASKLGLGAHFWGGDVEAGYRHQLGPSGITLEALREHAGGVRVPLEPRYRKYAEQKDGSVAGFPTPTRKVEIYAETLLEHGYPPLPEYLEPAVSPVSQPSLAERYPLVLTCAKLPQFCHSQHRALPSLRRRVPDPEIDMHPSTAAERGIRPGDWVTVETPDGSMRARARLNESLHPSVASGQHGWWQACPEIGAEGYDALSPEGANYNLAISDAAVDPISGTSPLRSYLCQITRVD